MSARSIFPRDPKYMYLHEFHLSQQQHRLFWCSFARVTTVGKQDIFLSQQRSHAQEFEPPLSLLLFAESSKPAPNVPVVGVEFDGPELRHVALEQHLVVGARGRRDAHKVARHVRVVEEARLRLERHAVDPRSGFFNGAKETFFLQKFARESGLLSMIKCASLSCLIKAKCANSKHKRKIEQRITATPWNDNTPFL